MKRNVILISAVLLSFMCLAFGFTKWNKTTTQKCQKVKGQKVFSNYYVESNTEEEIFSDFFYDFGPRFNMTISKSQLQKALTVADILPADDLKNIERYKSVNVILLKNDEQTDIRAKGYSEEFTEAQLKLFRSMDYSTNFLLRTDFENNRNETREDFNFITPHMTVVPEKQVEYKEGKKALLSLISAKNKPNTIKLDKTKLQPAKLYFTVTKAGEVKKIYLDRGCGFSNIDIDMIEMITNTNAKWIPAANEKGEKVDQELVLSYGMVGC